MPTSADSQDRLPALPYRQRQVWGRVIKPEPHVLHFRLESQPYDLPAAQIPEWVRVRKEDWLAGRRIEDYPQDSRHRLFLIQPTQEDSHLWHASLAWDEADDNPWNPDSPRRLQRGDTVTGTVIRYVGDYAALVRLDGSGIEAFLHRADTPEPQADIRRSLHIGDSIQALIMADGTDFERLRVWISVNEAVEATKRAFFERYRAHQHRDATKEAQRHEAWITTLGAPEDPPFAGLRLLLVEHDTAYARQLGDLIEGMGGNLVIAAHPQHVEQLLKEPEPFTHILSDYQMGTGGQRKDLFAVLKRSRLPVALMSGDYREALEEAARQGWSMLCKPVSYADLHRWLVDGTTPALPLGGEDISAAWNLGVESKATLRRAVPSLARFCKETGVVAACWLRRQREGVFAPLASHGLINGLPESIQARLATSLVANVIGNRRNMARAAIHAGPLGPLAESISAVGVWGLPLMDEAGDANNAADAPDALLLFTREAPSRDAPMPNAWAVPFERLRDRLLDLGEMALLTERLREADSFATLGRVSGAVLHEIRQALQGFETYLPLAVRSLKSGRQEQTAQCLQELATTKDRITSLARDKLYNLQKARREEVAFKERIPEILYLFDPAFQRHEWLLTCELPEHPVTAWLPPEVVEQPLINLLDNALHHLRDWGGVRVVVRRMPEDQACPIHIEVHDQGLGMTAEQLDQLFTPRVSSKGTKGYGLGLYTSRQLLRAVGGDLEVIRDGCFRWLGSGFRIRLPDQVASRSTGEAA
jgi:signal transduction histidine kinase